MALSPTALAAQAKAAAAAAATAQATLTAQMQASLANLYAIRDGGLLRKTQKIGPIENAYEYRSDKELLAAINGLERRLGITSPTSIVVHGRKGWSRRCW